MAKLVPMISERQIVYFETLGRFRTSTNTITNTSSIIFLIIKGMAFASGKCQHIEANQQNHVRLARHELDDPQNDDVIVIVFVLVRSLPIQWKEAIHTYIYVRQIARHDTRDNDSLSPVQKIIRTKKSKSIGPAFSEI
jgi:hypothetical protein